MVNKAGNKGRIGENGIVNHLNKWFAQPELFGPRRGRSRGSNDDGDLTRIPLTMIECKNYKNPTLTKLINNARIKAINSGCPIWFLTIKRARKSENNAGWWYAASDLHSIGKSLGFTLTEEELDKLRDKKDAHAVIKDIGEWGTTYGKNFAPPTYRWRVCLINDGRTGHALEAVHDMIEWWEQDEGIFSTCDEEELDHDRIVPIVIVRAAGAEYDDLEKWYALTTVHYMARMLESMAIIPQNEEEYDEESDIFWLDTVMDRKPEYEIFAEKNK